MTPPSDPAARRGGPVLVGGTGRSGTTVLGELVGARRDLATVPVELRFQCDPGGLVDLAAGRVDVDASETRLRRRWFRRPANPQGPRGVHVISGRRRVGEAMTSLRAALADPEQDRWRACGGFLDDVVRPWSEREGAADWAEMTPPNAGVFDSLARMLPDGRFLHIVRDGRDVAASVARRSWGPDDVPAALAWWGDRMVDILTSVAATPSDRVMTLRLEAMVGPRREEHYAEVERFLGRGPDDGMRAFFDRQMTLGSARPGAWATDLDVAERARVDDLYAEQRARVAALGLEMVDGRELAGVEA